MSHHCATEFGVRGFTEVLRTEMLLDRRRVAVALERRLRADG
ncbi:hypothetical protein [Gordonia sp. NPDC003376]